MKPLARCLILPLLALGSAPPAHAQFDPQWAFSGAPEATALHSSYVLQQLAYNSAMRSSGVTPSRTPRPRNLQPPSRPAPLHKLPVPQTFVPRAGTIAPARLAQSYPPAARVKAEQVFAQSLITWHRIEAQAGLSRNDLGGALAAFIAGNYTAYRNEPFPDALFKPLVEQMQQALESSGTLGSTSSLEKQELYETLAIIGTFMSTTNVALQRNPDPAAQANTRAAARGYLDQALKLDPDRLRFTDHGMVVN